VRDVTTFSMYLFVIDIAIQIGFNLDNLVIGAALGTSAVAVYAVAMRLADYQRQMCNQFNGLLFPVIVRFGAVGNTDALRATLVDGTRIALTLVVGVTIGVIAFAEPLIGRWMGPGFAGSVAPLYVLAVTGVVLVGQGPLGNVLLGTGRHRLVAFVSLAEAIANLVLSLILVRRYGILGVAMGTAVPVVLANLLILLPAACRQINLSVTAFGHAVATGPLIGAVPAIVAAAVLRTALPPVSLPAIFLEGSIICILYLAAVCMFGFDSAVRARYFGYVQQLLTPSKFVRSRPRVSSAGVRI
jgi:O-antigen/teichoic acid export membrane protein